MIIHGLHHQISNKRQAAGLLAREARDPDCNPRTAHEKGLEAELMALDAEELADHAKANEEVMQAANKLLHYLASSKHQSRYRSLAITDFESAINWLVRENGDPEPERNFLPVSEPMPVNTKPESKP